MLPGIRPARAAARGAGLPCLPSSATAKFGIPGWIPKARFHRGGIRPHLRGGRPPARHRKPRGQGRAQHLYQENNTLQVPFFEQVFKPLVREANARRRDNLYIIGDSREKIDKAARIEANLEPLDRNGQLVFNEVELNNPHLREMRDQFALFELTLPYPADGPDAVEGAVNVIARKTREMAPGLAIGYGELREGDRRNRF